jgi:hypothetical protein
MAKPQEPKKPKPEEPRELSQIENMNAALAEAYEQLGYFKAITIQKAALVRMANMEGIPLSGIDVIKTQQGPKLYINQEGAKWNRDKYLTSQGREVSGRTVEVLDQIAGSNIEQDKAQGRKYFKTTTHVKSQEYINVINGIAMGKVDPKIGMELLKQITEANTYVSWSAFSNVSETFNKIPEHILKKGQTQAHRRADLEIAKPHVLPADEEPMDAQFVVKDSPATPDVAKAAAAAGAAVLVPDNPAEAPAPEPAAEAPPENQELVKERIGQLAAILSGSGKLDKVGRLKWLGDNKFPTNIKEATIEILDKMVSVAKVQFEKPAAPAEPPKAPTPPKEEAPKADPAKQEILHKVFGLRGKAGFASDDAVRTWVKKVFGKGLSEMNIEEGGKTVERIAAFASLLANKEKWEMKDDASIFDYAKGTKGKDLHDMTPDEVKVVETELGGLF